MTNVGNIAYKVTYTVKKKICNFYNKRMSSNQYHAGKNIFYNSIQQPIWYAGTIFTVLADYTSSFCMAAVTISY